MRAHNDAEAGESLVRSRQRVIEHGEVFTPRWLVRDMVDLVADEATRADARFLEPACGSGNFLVEVLERRLDAMRGRYRCSPFEHRHASLLGLMCLYGIELLPDNVAECRANLLDVFRAGLGLGPDDEWARAARTVLAANVVQGDALAMTDAAGRPIELSEWAYLGRGRYQRRDFAYKDLTRRSATTGTLFDQFDDEELFAPVRSHPVMTVGDLAAMGEERSVTAPVTASDRTSPACTSATAAESGR
jgi:hypothetical protein